MKQALTAFRYDRLGFQRAFERSNVDSLGAPPLYPRISRARVPCNALTHELATPFHSVARPDAPAYGPFLPFNGLFRLFPDRVVQASVKAARLIQPSNARGWQGSKLEDPSRELTAELAELEKEFTSRNEKRHPQFNQFQVGLPSNVLNSISI